GLLFLIGAICLLETIQPDYFTQDDNLTAQPPTVTGCRSLLSGVFPTWNPYQFMGQPTSVQSWLALTYPPTYLCYLVARQLGNEFLFIEVFCIAHLLAGYAATYWASRAAGLRPMLAALGGLCMALSGCTLIMGRSYFHMTPVIVWTPLLIVALINLQQRPATARWVLGTGLVIGIFCHSGNGQMWTYAVMLWLTAALALVCSGALPVRRALCLIPALLLGCAIAAPLIVPQMSFIAGLPRRSIGGGGIGPGVLSLLLPYPLTRAEHPNQWGSTDIEFMGQFYYSGTLFAAVAFAAGLLILGVLAVYRCDRAFLRRLTAQNVWLLCAAIAFFLALGPEGVLWVLLGLLPVFKLFTGPWKFLLFLNLFLPLGGGLIVERWLRGTKSPQRAEAMIALAVCALLLYHTALARPSFYSYGSRLYPPLPPPMATLLRSGGSTPQRILPFAPQRSISPDFVFSLRHNLPTAYGIFSFDGYDPFVPITPPNQQASARLQADPIRAARAYGVRWLIVHRLAEHPVYSPNPVLRHQEQIAQPPLRLLASLRRQARRRQVLPAVTIWELSDSSPLAFATAAPQRALPIEFDEAGARVDVSPLRDGGRVVINILRRPEMALTADKRVIPVEADSWGRIVTTVPAGTRVLEMRYAPPWSKGFLVGALLAVFSVVLTVGLLRWQRGSALHDAAEKDLVAYP
ncbi:MAG: hypothetical protein M3347_05680, partial [Armatimonadota bacterium]|nr:hypothetical protein [Armatimonadota bacterium]